MKASNQQKVTAYQHVLAMYKAKKLGAFSSGGCVYRDRNRRCAVGCFFNDAQLDDISKQRLNSSTSVSVLADRIGKKNIERVTGLDVATLMDLQLEHDNACDYEIEEVRRGDLDTEFAKYLQRRIAHWSMS